jgi:asparagine synthase (glutamine-hydrolysing)
MTNEDQTVWIVFNGEIYNFETLRPQLEAAGHRFSSDSDTEVLIHGYEEGGAPGLLERINGMFAFAIWDARKRHLLLARDRLGKKPLYYGWIDGRFLFSSDIKSFWIHDPSGVRVSEESISRFLYWRYLPGRETIYHNISSLLPGYYLVLREDATEERRYWELSFARKHQGSVSEILEQTGDVLRRAVRRRLRSDVPLGAFLSGGVDSSYVVSEMGGEHLPPVRTFSIGTDDPEHDERTQAKIVAAHCGTIHTEFQITPDAWSLLPRLVWEFGQPFGDAAAIPTYYVARCAREYVTVALTGDGGDESFAGYSHHHAQHLAAFIMPWMPTRVLNWLLETAQPLLDSGKRSALASSARFMRYAHEDPLIACAPVTSWALHHFDKIWAPGRGHLGDREILLGYSNSVLRDFDGESTLDRSLHYDLHFLLPFCYNVKVDVATMMSSLEARCPFQDQEVVEWAAGINPHLKLRHGEKKYLLKRLAASRVPPSVIYRSKHGFSIPLHSWFSGSWAKLAHELILGTKARSRGLFNYAYIERLWQEHQAGRARHETRFWLLLWLEIWFRIFVDRTLGPDDPLGQVRTAQ